MDKDLAAKNMRLGALFFVIALIMFGLSFVFAVVFLKGNGAEGQEAVAPTGTAAAEQTPAPQEAPPGEATPPARRRRLPERHQPGRPRCSRSRRCRPSNSTKRS
jgi:hypothetical protein